MSKFDKQQAKSISIHLFFIVWISIIFCCLPTDITSSPSYYFNQISLKEGLTQTTVHATLRDSYGFLWIGTAAGLNRFDGHEIKTYKSLQTVDDDPLLGSRIFYIAEDALNNLWVSTNGGLLLYDRSNDLFAIQKIGTTRFISNAYLLASDGIIACSSGSLLKYGYQTKEWTVLPLKSQLPLNFNFTGIIHLTTSELLLSSRHNGIYRYNMENNRLEKVDLYYGNYDINTIFADSKNRIWVAVYGKGLYCYSSDGKMIATYNSKNSGLNNDVVLTIEEKNEKLWFGTDGGGINILDIHNGQFEKIHHVPEDAASFPANSIISLYKDKWNTVWAGTIRDGLLELKEVNTKVYQQAPFGNPYGLSNEAVISIFEDDDGSIWVGTDGGGINKLDARTGLITHFHTSIEDKVTSIAPYSNDELLISIFTRGVYFFNKKTGLKRPLIIVDKSRNDHIVNSNYAITIHTDDSEQYYLLSFELDTYKRSNQKFSEPSLSIGQGKLNMITSHDYDHTYIYSPTTLFEYTSSGNLVKLYETDKRETIHALTIDRNNTFWIGTEKGLKHFNPEIPKIETVDTPIKTAITALVYDNKERLWIGTRGEVWCFDMANNLFSQFGESDGVIPNEYLARPTLVSQSGNIYMGGVNGLLVIDANIEPKTVETPQILLTEVLSNDEERQRLFIMGQDAEPKLRLAWNKSSIILSIIANEKDIFRKRLFRYYISGLSPEPIETENQHLALQALPSGHYTVAVSSSLPNGHWTEPIEVLWLNIMPPWWKSTWFRLLIILFLSASVALAVHQFIRKRENALKWELKEQEKKVFEEKVNFLINVSHELRTPLTLIYAPLKRMLKRLPEKEDLQDELSNITKQATHMKQIIDMVLDTHKMEAGHDELRIQWHTLHEWISQTANLFTDEARHRDITFHYFFDDRIKEVPFDMEKCTIVLSNLLSNALKFSKSNSSITIQTSLLEAQDRIRVTVTDEGEGLDNVDMKQLFTRFYRGKHNHSGSGIGLAFSKVLIDLHGGTIEAENNKNGKGASFFFELPLNQHGLGIPIQPEKHLKGFLIRETYQETSIDYSIPQIDTSLYSLLVVEDNPEFLAFLKQHFRDKFKIVHSATNGKEALEIIHHDLPDIVVSDVMMPVMDGYDLCRRIKSDVEISHIPVILLTARAGINSVQFGYKLGADAYVTKPFEMEFLQTVMENQLKLREQIKARYRSEATIPLPQEMTFSNADERFILKLNTLIEKHMAEPNLNVAFISSEIGMSRTSLYNKMKELLNVGVNDYVNRVRFEKACLLLVDHPELSIADIATMVGFSSQRYFSTSFKAWKGISPSEYRSNNLNS